jgi:hypothetical protein
MLGQALAQSALARGRGPVDGDDQAFGHGLKRTAGLQARS